MDGLYVQFEGCLFNEDEVKKEIHEGNVEETTISQLIASLYRIHGVNAMRYLRGEFVFSIVDKIKETIYLFRDRIGVKTIYYTTVNGLLVYSTSMDKILKYPGVKAVLNKEGACELLGMGPARTPGLTPFQGISELLPGSYLTFSKRGMQVRNYWQLETKEHKENLEETIERGRELFEEILASETKGEEPGFLLSGGLDSSFVSAVWQKKHGEMDTYSLDFPNSANFFTANPFQPDLDRPYVDIMVKHLSSRHSYVYCSVEQQADGLVEAMEGHNLPCMVDIQSTLNYFCGEIGKKHRLIVTGECADEIFGGYPWFHVSELLNKEGFCWGAGVEIRELLLRDYVKDNLKLGDYVTERYQESIKPIQYLETESEEERMLRQKAYLTIHYFMQTLIRRTVVATSMHGMEARVPFADPTLVEYAYNIPWSMKKKDGVRKYILRQMSKAYLPEVIVDRPKSPYPKNPDPTYGRILREWWLEEIKRDCPIMELVDPTKLRNAIDYEEDFPAPWFGQLMRKPQLLAYYWQVNEWLKRYQIDIDLH